MDADSNSKQLLFNFKSENWYSSYYYVVHKNIEKEVLLLDRLLKGYDKDNPSFNLIYVFGDKGCGKTHFINYCLDKYKDSLSSNYKIVDIGKEDCEDPKFIAKFISIYDCMKTDKDILIVEGIYPACSEKIDRHLRTRLLSGIALNIPIFEEVESALILRSLMEKSNLRLSDHCIQIVLNNLRHNPLIFERILDIINELCVLSDRSPGASVVREAIKNFNQQKI